MRAKITITDLTRMQGTRICVAGVLPSGECIRPVLRGAVLNEAWLFQHRLRVLKPFAVVEMDLIRPAPDLMPPHTEDWEIGRTYAWCYELSLSDRFELLHTLTSSHLRSVFGAALEGENDGGRGRWLQQGTGTRSLGTIHLRRVMDIAFHVSHHGKGDYRIEFEDEAGEVYRLSVTDLAFRMHLDALMVRDGLSAQEAAAAVRDRVMLADDVFLRLGLARNWDKYPDRCYVQVNGVYSFPDYLDGRCFADFIIEPTRIDVPF